MRAKRKTSRALHRATYDPGGGVLHDVKRLLKSAGLEDEAERLRSLQTRSMAAYEAGRMAEGDRLAARADILVEKIDDTLIALEEEGEPQQEPIIQSVTRQMAEAWHACMSDRWNASCREEVEEYRRTGHGRWQEPSVAFVGPVSKWGHGDPANHPEWYRSVPGYYQEPTLVHGLRDILGDPEANGLLLLDAAEDAWLSTIATSARIRAGAKKRRISGVDPVTEAKRWVRRITRRKKPVKNRRRTSRRRTSRRRSSRIRS
jgi:hypothetical protein